MLHLRLSGVLQYKQEHNIEDWLSADPYKVDTKPQAFPQHRTCRDEKHNPN